MSKTEKRINKWLIGLVIGGAILGGISRTKQGKNMSKGFFYRVKTFFTGGLREIKKTAKKNSEK